MRKTLAAVAAGLMLVTGASAACELPEIVGKPYPEAREAMIAAGWNPEPQSEPMEDRARFATWVHVRGYDEVESCAGTGVAPCRFAFVRDPERALYAGAVTLHAQMRATVFTVYEEIGEVSAARCE